jgi:hypothetical protein
MSEAKYRQMDNLYRMMFGGRAGREDDDPAPRLFRKLSREVRTSDKSGTSVSPSTSAKVSIQAMRAGENSLSPREMNQKHAQALSNNRHHKHPNALERYQMGPPKRSDDTSRSAILRAQTRAMRDELKRRARLADIPF